MKLSKEGLAEIEAVERERALRLVATEAMKHKAAVEGRVSTAMSYLDYWIQSIQDPATKKMAGRVKRILQGEFS